MECSNCKSRNVTNCTIPKDTIITIIGRNKSHSIFITSIKNKSYWTWRAIKDHIVLGCKDCGHITRIGITT